MNKLMTIIFALLLIINIIIALPLDLYDDFEDNVADLLDTISLDDENRQARIQPTDRCKMPIRKGVCRALIPRWSYDPIAQKCLEFKFGGCDGNANNFLNEKQCMEMCKGIAM